MPYEFPITVSANTLKGAPKIETLKLHHGIVHSIAVEMPAGCNAKVHLQLYRYEHLIFPATPDGSYASDNTDRAWEVYHELLDAPFELKARCWSPGTTYDHTIRVRIAILPTDVYWRNAPNHRLEGELAKLVGLS